ncbi:hypothetical protein V9T40_002428 [Parthenolecanium corni]|uniref:Uncharacterized protein n=1 Tax=Parthenolecanium corni TaxID=536013 RepID=A0AAN9TIV8_9HEMI
MGISNGELENGESTAIQPSHSARGSQFVESSPTSWFGVSSLHTLSFPTRNNPSTRQSKDKISSSILSPTPTKDKTPASTPDVSFFLLL